MLLVQGQAYRAQYGFNVIHLLPANLYGPRDNFDLASSHVIPALIRKCIEAKEVGVGRVTLWGDGSSTREFLYVEDAAEAIVLATQRYNGGEPVNVGNGVEMSISALARFIADAVGFDGEIAWDHSKPNGQRRRVLDVQGAARLFGFKATTGFAEGLARTVAWFQNNRFARHRGAL
jgi:GDP-L-fucose synthase